MDRRIRCAFSKKLGFVGEMERSRGCRCKEEVPPMEAKMNELMIALYNSNL